jgi:hypothetical protein
MASSFARRFVTGIDANRTLKDELSEAAGRQRARRRISVTDLVNPRQTFFRWTHPEIQPSPERLQAMLSGSGFHELFGRAVSTEEFVEQFVEFDGIVGKVDIYEDVPTELKTTGSIPADIPASRPSYLDQLGMYCTMVGNPNGRLLVYKRAQYGGEPVLKAFDVAYRDLASLAREMRRRRELLEAALASNDPAGLQRCEWFETGCDYRSICGCEGAPTLVRVVPQGAARVQENAELTAALSGRLRKNPEAPTRFGLNDLVFPRKAAFERRSGDEEEAAAEAAVEASLARLEREGFIGALKSALRFGIPGAFRSVPVSLRTLKGFVGTYKGAPTLLRSTKMAEMVHRDRLPEIFSHYFDRLAFECALTGQTRGRIVIYYESLEDKFMVYDVHFKDLAAVRAEADRRLALLEARAAPQQLPPCPKWMAKLCRFAPGCGCGQR